MEKRTNKTAVTCRRGGLSFALLAAVALLGSAAHSGSAGWAFAAGTADPSASAEAFLKASAVFFDPRCVNCHPAGNRPLVGDQSLPHPMHVERGPQGLGRNGLWCSTCHQEKNLHDPHTPPGAPEWMLPPADMPMVFEKRTPRQLCEQFKDPTRNGSRTPSEIAEHVREAPRCCGGGIRARGGGRCRCLTTSSCG